MGGRNAETLCTGRSITRCSGATREIEAGLPNAGQLTNLTSMPSDAVVGPTPRPQHRQLVRSMRSQHYQRVPLSWRVKAVLLADGNVTLQLESEVVVGLP